MEVSNISGCPTQAAWDLTADDLRRLAASLISDADFTDIANEEDQEREYHVYPGKALADLFARLEAAGLPPRFPTDWPE